MKNEVIFLSILFNFLSVCKNLKLELNCKFVTKYIYRILRYEFHFLGWIGKVIILNRASWSGGIGTSAEVPAITSSRPGHNGFNMVSVWPPWPASFGWTRWDSRTKVRIPRLSKKKKYIYIYRKFHNVDTYYTQITSDSRPLAITSPLIVDFLYEDFPFN